MPYHFEDDDNENDAGSLQKFFSNRDFERTFLNQRKIFLWGAVHDKSAREIVNKILFLENEKSGVPITFYINSPGGIVTSGMVIHDIMKAVSSPIHTVCLGLAASMGSILLSAGEKGHRAIFPNGEVMIHQPALGGMFQGTSADISIQAKQIEKTKNIGAKILADNCRKTLAQILQDFDRDFWLNPEEAIAYGIVDKLISKI